MSDDLPSASASPLGLARLALRTAGFCGLTLGVVGMLEVDAARGAEADREAVLAAWKERYGRWMLRVLGVRVTSRGPHLGSGERYAGRDEHGVGRVFVMNHRSMVDIFVSLAFVDASIVSRADLASWPVLGAGARRVGTLFVERGNKKSGAAVVDAMSAALLQRRGVMVYPEGGTHAGDDVWPFRAGAFAAAARARAEIVPLGIAYAEPAAEFVDEPLVTHLRRTGATPRTHVALVAGEPLARGADVLALQEEAHARVQRLVLEARALVASPRT